MCLASVWCLFMGRPVPSRMMILVQKAKSQFYVLGTLLRPEEVQKSMMNKCEMLRCLFLIHNMYFVALVCNALECLQIIS